MQNKNSHDRSLNITYCTPKRKKHPWLTYMDSWISISLHQMYLLIVYRAGLTFIKMHEVFFSNWFV